MCFILPEHNLGFVHIPKTAGQSITKWAVDNLNVSFLEHQHGFSEQIKCGSYFAVVRNPYDRIISWYEFTKSNKRFWKINGVDSVPPLKQFIERTYDMDIRLTENYFAPYKIGTNQVDWIKKDGRIVLRYENLNDDFKIIQDMCNCHINLQHINCSNRSYYRDYYDSETKKLVKKIYEKDFDTFKYTW